MNKSNVIALVFEDDEVTAAAKFNPRTTANQNSGRETGSSNGMQMDICNISMESSYLMFGSSNMVDVTC